MLQLLDLLKLQLLDPRSPGSSAPQVSSLGCFLCQPSIRRLGIVALTLVEQTRSPNLEVLPVEAPAGLSALCLVGILGRFAGV